MVRNGLKEGLIDLSVIIVNWNTKDLLLACLDSLTAQKSSCQTEVVVVDNASNDGSAEIVKDKYPQVIVIQNAANLGFGKANNIGIKRSRGRYICLLNSDVRVMPECLQSLFNFMEHNESIGISSPLTLSPDMTVQDTCRKLPTLWNNMCDLLYLNRLFPKSDALSGEHMMFFDHRSTRKVEGLAGCCLMIRKAALDRIGLFDERFFIYFEETDLCKRFGQAGWDIVFFPGASIVHHHGASAAKDFLRFSGEQIKSQVKYWDKHHGIIAVTLFLFMLLIQHSVRLMLRSIFYIFSASARKIEIARQLSKHHAILKFILSGKYNS